MFYGVEINDNVLSKLENPSFQEIYYNQDEKNSLFESNICNEEKTVNSPGPCAVLSPC